LKEEPEMTAPKIRLGFAASLVFSAAIPALGGVAPPRYALEPGQVLTYEEAQTFHARSYSSEYKTRWQLWVVGRNDDGSWRIVARQSSRSKRDQGSTPSEHETVVFARFDLDPDGTIPRCPTLGTRVEPSQVFPRLPGDAREASAGWQARDDRDGATVDYRPLAAKETGDEGVPTFDFDGVRSTFMERFYEGTDHRTFHFDRSRGLVVRAEIARAYGSHLQGKGGGTLTLLSVEKLEPAKRAAFAAEMDRYFTAHLAFDELYRRAGTAGAAAAIRLKEARAVLADARSRVTLPDPIAALDEALRSHDTFSKHRLEDAKRFAELIGRPAPAWEIKDLAGQTHALEQYRGKVLVLDFWYRGCGWCMRAMPQVKEVARHYRDRPVAVFGMNNDRNEEDARFVAREMELDYPVLRSMDLPEKYGVHGFPTLVIIDQQGKVSTVHVGYSPQLFEDVTSAVDRLLGAR
jgi:thiol-disulfide isomerase/thioredoxin